MLPEPAIHGIEVRLVVVANCELDNADDITGKLVPVTTVLRPTEPLNVDEDAVIPLLLDIIIGDTPPDDGGSGLCVFFFLFFSFLRFFLSLSSS